MSDMLVPLYSLPPLPVPAGGFEIRRPLPHEKGVVKAWIARSFDSFWAEEFEASFKAHPVTSFIAVCGQQLVGFACYEVTCRAFFGPTGVVESERGRGIGRTLLLHAMHGLRELGYAYGIIGGAGPVDFYKKTLPGATIIENSTPGIFPARPLMME